MEKILSNDSDLRNEFHMTSVTEPFDLMLLNIFIFSFRPFFTSSHLVDRNRRAIYNVWQI